MYAAIESAFVQYLLYAGFFTARVGLDGGSRSWLTLHTWSTTSIISDIVYSYLDEVDPSSLTLLCRFASVNDNNRHAWIIDMVTWRDR